ncbi:hypothetical protein MAR_010648 [Mya arenaria]|uniref:Uncharacterized protein n=1 Tax=Mya arenaria TaxID=6604 RepID=A0ABY7FUI7_MYAAR|nr:hypothetical protein MAR_010648 [Mya arenaria]
MCKFPPPGMDHEFDDPGRLRIKPKGKEAKVVANRMAVLDGKPFPQQLNGSVPLCLFSCVNFIV